MTPTPTGRAVALLALVAGLAAVADAAVVAVALGVWGLALVVDAVTCPAPWVVGVSRELPPVLALGGTGRLEWEVHNPTGRRLAVALADDPAPSLGAEHRRPTAVVPAGGRVRSGVALRPARRGTFRLRDVVVRVAGPLGLVTRQAPRTLHGVIEVHPSFRSRDAATLRIRRARVLEEGRRAVRGRGGGGELEQLREYVEGDDVRHVDWAATARTGVPIVRVLRPERNQSVLVLLDTGRVVAGRVEGVPRLDHAMDATLALATVASHVGDRTGLLAFGAGIRTVEPPRRGELRRLSRAMHALEPELAESAYTEAARVTLTRFRRRALVVVLTELAPEAAEQRLLPVLFALAREHAVVVGAVRDPSLLRLRAREVREVGDAYAAAAAAGVLAERRRLAFRLRAGGVRVVDEPPARLAAALVDAYLDVKTRGGW